MAINTNFMLGFGTALLFGTEKGRDILKATTNTTGSLAENMVKFGLETLDEALPSVSKAITEIKTNVGNNPSNNTNDSTENNN